MIRAKDKAGSSLYAVGCDTYKIISALLSLKIPFDECWPILVPIKSLEMDKLKIKIIGLAIILVTLHPAVEGVCVLENLGTQPCSGQLRCSDDLSEAINEVNNWQCRKKEYYDYTEDYYGRRRQVKVTRLDEDYFLLVHAQAIEDTSLEPFSVIKQLSDHIHSLSVTQGNMASIPAALLGLKNAVKVDLSRNAIESLNLDAFPKSKLKTFNVSFNQIAVLEGDEISVSAEIGQLTRIDLSHNAIKTIPKYYFRKFPYLLHLNLSHNYIENFEFLTFEGITQLKTLYVSNNKLYKLGHFFARFVNLKVLNLDHNNLTSIENSNFNTMTQLEELNISYNNLISIDNASFDYLIEMKKMDISNNKIDYISKTWFRENTNLQSLDVSYNMIRRIEPGAFEGKNITNFLINNNLLSGSLAEKTFQGIHVDSFNLNGANVTELGPNLFEDLSDSLVSLNLSDNSLSNIHNTTFNNLKLLNMLDLSRNRLPSIDFCLTDLINLSEFYINNNNITKILQNTFQNLTNLKKVDFSNNEINEIEELSFEDLNKLESLNLINNPLPAIIAPQTFTGLSSCSNLDVTYSRINTLQSNAFKGMKSLKKFNISFGELKTLEFAVFNGTGSIELLDLSHNQIEVFDINNTDLRLVKEINLNYNKLQLVSSKTFSGLNNLCILRINNNHILRIDNEAFRSLQNLVKLDLAANKDVEFDSAVFSNLSLNAVYLNNISSSFNFEKVVNTLITDLDLDFCNIVDINSVQVYQITTIERLSLTSNKIKAINKLTFQKLRQLVWINLSNNRISSIQPGSFSGMEKLDILRLEGNYLSILQYGVLDGLSNLRVLELSNNTIHGIRAHLFHNTPRIQEVYVDNNLIENIDFDEFAATNIRKLSVGSNPMLCDTFINLKKKNYSKLTVTAKMMEYETENVHGITCNSITTLSNFTQDRSNETVLTATLLETIKEFKVTVERILNHKDPDTEVKTIFENVTTSIDNFQKKFNETKINQFLEKLTDVNNDTNRHLTNIEMILNNRDLVTKKMKNVNESKLDNDNKIPINEILEKQRQSLRAELKGIIDDRNSLNVASTQFQPQTAAVNSSTDLKSVLYFIGSCLALLLCVMVLKSIFVYYKLRNRILVGDGMYASRQPLSNVIEME